jgi:alanyl aminopeptidase
MTERSATLELATDRCPGWLLPNADYEGYYRFAMPEPELDALARVSRSQGAAAKVGYLTNLWALVRAGDVPAPKLLDALAELKRERDREVIEQLIAILTSVSDGLVAPSSRAAFQAYVASLLLPLAKGLGWDARAGDDEDDKLLRRSVLTALVTLTDDPWLVREADSRARAYLDGKGKVDADTAAIALRSAARRGRPEAAFDRLAAALAEASSTTRRVALVQALGSLGKPEDLRRTLALIDAGTIRMQDALYVMRAAVDWPESRAVFIAWLEDSLPELADRYPGFGVARMMYPLRRICDAPARDASRKAFEPIVRELGGLDRRLRQALENASLCIDLRSRQAAAVSSYLEARRW